MYINNACNLISIHQKLITKGKMEHVIITVTGLAEEAWKLRKRDACDY